MTSTDLKSTEVDLQELRKIVEQVEEEERHDVQQTQLLIIDTQRKRIKKLNPKYCCEWKDLEFEYKVNRIIEFVERFIEESDLPESTGKKIRKLLVKSQKDHQLVVEYDTAAGQITKVPKLYYNETDGYYLGTYLNDHGEFVTKVSKITKFKTLNLNPTTTEQSAFKIIPETTPTPIVTPVSVPIAEPTLITKPKKATSVVKKPKETAKPKETIKSNETVKPQDDEEKSEPEPSKPLKKITIKKIKEPIVEPIVEQEPIVATPKKKLTLKLATK
jgi:hypothetical protein